MDSKTVYIKRLSGDIININYNNTDNEYNEYNSLYKNVMKVLEDMGDEYTIHHPYIVTFKQSKKEEMLYFPPLFSLYNHPYNIFSLNRVTQNTLEEKENFIKDIKDGDIFGIVTVHGQKIFIVYNISYFNNSIGNIINYKLEDSSDNLLEHNYVQVDYIINFNVETHLGYKYNTIIKISLLRLFDGYEYAFNFRTKNLKIFDLEEVTIIDKDIKKNTENKDPIKFKCDDKFIKRSLYEAFYDNKKMNTFEPETRSCIVKELIDFIIKSNYNWMSCGEP
jgi:hypothetical protein